MPSTGIPLPAKAENHSNRHDVNKIANIARPEVRPRDSFWPPDIMKKRFEAMVREQRQAKERVKQSRGQTESLSIPERNRLTDAMDEANPEPTVYTRLGVRRFSWFTDISEDEDHSY